MAMLDGSLTYTRRRSPRGAYMGSVVVPVIMKRLLADAIF
jgi:hypothetical protein